MSLVPLVPSLRRSIWQRLLVVLMADIIWVYHASDLAHNAASATFSLAPRAIVLAGVSAWLPLWVLSPRFMELLRCRLCDCCHNCPIVCQVRKCRVLRASPVRYNVGLNGEVNTISGRRLPGICMCFMIMIYDVVGLRHVDFFPCLRFFFQ